MTEPRWLDQDEHHTWRSYLAATRLLSAQLDRELQRDSGIPQSYYEILVRLSESPDRRLRMSDLAEVSDSSRSRLSHAVARLVANGWVSRESCPTDRRGAFAVLTDEGFEALSTAAPLHVSSVRTHLFDRLTREQMLQLGQITDVIVAGLRDSSDEIAQECTARQHEFAPEFSAERGPVPEQAAPPQVA
ncbi:MarR family winged helix-turn-helix transcriptional regulator [Kineosporia succinea]|uniref:DNA-binding MarR family transcriptional regulator n=1 Tax=Kineosporia succinea TaxID=84632 RepID=A0ABT9P7E2_9ACTN|nr:MarR family transcriptional regulator [Kineosporia succinea]MDP9828609.1 DNA-binding MarR family transcriptional regulator [Kineosporia succinea]